MTTYGLPDNFGGSPSDSPTYSAGFDAVGAFDNYFAKTASQPFQAPSMANYYSGLDTAPSLRGAIAPVAAPSPVMPPPIRFQSNPLDSFASAAIDSPLGVAAGLSAPEQRGGVTHFGPVPVAVAPVNAGNFATYAREAQLAAVTSVLGNHYQQGPNGEAPTAPDNPSLIDNIISGINKVGEVVNAPFQWLSDRVRESAAQQRASGFAALVKNTSVPGYQGGGGFNGASFIQLITHPFDLDGMTSYEGILREAAAKNVTPTQLAADLWDLSPDVVEQIVRDPNRPSDQIASLTKQEPFSHHPFWNIVSELGITLAPMLVGAGELRGAALALKGVEEGTAGIKLGVAGGALARSSIPARLGLTPAARALGVANDIPQLGRIPAIAERLGAWSLPKAWRAARIVGAATGITPTGMAIGGGIRFGEWAIANIGAWTGNKSLVDAADRWLYEMPLSNNPGLNMIDAFSVPREGLVGKMKGGVSVVVHGVGDVIVDKALGKQVVNLSQMTLPEVQRTFLDPMGFDPAHVDGIINNPASGVSLNDLKNALVHAALQVVRSRHPEAEATYLAAGEGIPARNAEFLKRFGPEAAQVIRDEVAGKSHAIADAFTGEFWTRARTLDASELGAQGGIGPYHAPTAMVQLFSWIRASKAIANAYGDVGAGLVPALRPDVNRAFLSSFRDEIRQAYPRPNDVIRQGDLNRLTTFIPAAKQAGLGILRGQTKTPRITRARFEDLLNELDSLQSRIDEQTAMPRGEVAPAVPPTAVDDPVALSRIFKLKQDSIVAVQRAAAQGADAMGTPLPADLAKVLRTTQNVSREEILRNPTRSWERAAEWWQSNYEAAVARGQAVSTMEDFGRSVNGIPREQQGLLDAAIARINDALSRPLGAGGGGESIPPLVANVLAERDAQIATLVDRARAWLDDPRRTMVVSDAGQGPVLMTANYGPVMGRLIDEAAALVLAKDAKRPLEGLTAADRARLADPTTHPLEKAQIIRDSGATLPVKYSGVAEAPTLAGAYSDLLDRTKGPGEPAEPVTPEAVARLTDEVVRTLHERDQIIADAQGVASIASFDPRRVIAPDVKQIINQGEAIATQGILNSKGKRIGTASPWHELPVTSNGVRLASNAQAVADGAAIIERRIAAADQVLSTYEAKLKLASERAGDVLGHDDFTWEPEPLEKFKTDKAARDAARAYTEAGIPVEIRDVPSPRQGRKPWRGIFRGELKPASERPTAADVQAAYDAGNIAEGQALNTEVAVARGGTPESGGAIKAPAVASTPDHIAWLQGLSDAALKDEIKGMERAVANKAPGVSPASEQGRLDSARAELARRQAPPEGTTSAPATPGTTTPAAPAEGTPDVAALEGQVGAARAEVAAMEARGEHFGIALVGDKAVRELARVRAEQAAAAAPPMDALALASEVHRLTREALGASEDLYGPKFLRGSAVDRFDQHLAERTAYEQAQIIEKRAHDALIASGVRPPFVGQATRLGVAIIPVKWEGDVPIALERNRAQVARLESEAIPISPEAIAFDRAYRKDNAESGYWSKADQKMLADAEAWLSSAEADQLRSFMVQPEAVQHTPPPAPAPVIVQKLAEPDRVAQAQQAAFEAETQARQEAFAAHAAAFPEKVLVPHAPAEAPAIHGRLPADDTRFMGRPGSPPDIGEAVVVGGVKYRIRGYRPGALNPKRVEIEVAPAGPNWRRSPIAGTINSNLLWQKVGGLWQSSLNVLNERPAEATTAAPATVTFLDPQDNATPIHSNVVLVDANDVLTSADPAYPDIFQPRDRAGRVASEKQITKMAGDIQPDKLFGTASGAEGMPVIAPDGFVLSGNGRTQALRLASRTQFAKYKAALATEAVKYGFDPAVIEGMDRPVLFRQLEGVDPVTMRRLAWQLNPTGMAVGDLATAFADSIQPADVEALKVAEKQSLRDALAADKNAALTQRIIDRLPPDWQSEYIARDGTLNDRGVGLVEGAIFAKLLRADVPGPHQAAARDLVVTAIEEGGEEMRRVFNGVSSAAGAMLRAQAKADAGTIGAEYLSTIDTLSGALNEILRMRRDEKSMSQIAVDLQTVNAFAEFDAPAQVKHMGAVLASSTQTEIGTFLRAIAKAAEDNATAGMFDAAAPVEATGLLNSGIRAWNAERKRANKTELDMFPSSEAPYDTTLTAPRDLPDGSTAAGILQSQPVQPAEVAGEVDARAQGPVAVDAESLSDAASATQNAAGVNLRDPGERALYEAYKADPEAVRADIADAFDNARKFRFGQVHDYIAGLVEEANQGTIAPGDWAVLREILSLPDVNGQLGTYFRRNTRGHLNNANIALSGDMWREVMANGPDRVLAQLDTAIGMSTAPTAAASRLVHVPAQDALTPEAFAAVVGPDVPHSPPDPIAADLATTADHTLTTTDNPTVTADLRRRTGAPDVLPPGTRVIELNAPTGQAMVDRLSALAQQARAEAEAARAQLADFKANPPIPPEVQTTAVFTPEVRGLWEKFMQPVANEDAVTPGVVPDPHRIGALMDAIDSIDRHAYGNLTPEEAQTLRAALMRLAQGSLNDAQTRLGAAAQRRVTARVRMPEDFNPDEVAAAAAQLMDGIAPLVVTDPSLPPLEGFMGTQYIVSPPPAGSPIAPISPRLVFQDYLGQDLLPGLSDELRSGRMMEFGERIRRSRLASVLDAIVGPRSTREMRKNSIENFGEALSTFTPENAPLEAAHMAETAGKVVEAWWKASNTTQFADVRFSLYRRIDIMGRDRLAEIAKPILEEFAPATLQAMTENSASLDRIWRRADNRIRQQLIQSDLPFTAKLERYYGKVADSALGQTGRWITGLYNVIRFAGEIRWMALEATEPIALGFFHGGLDALTRTAEPMGFGKVGQDVARRNFAQWNRVSDIEQVTPLRWRVLIRELGRRQAAPLVDTLHTMFNSDPQFQRMLADLGDTPKQFLDRLNRDWALAEQGTREFASEAEAAAFFKPWKDAGVIDPATFDSYVKARKYQADPRIEHELGQVLGDPVAATLYTRLAQINHGLWHDLTGMFFGQEDRSNLQRVLNNPFLYWPISYQIKATKWLLHFMTKEAFGIESGALGAVAMQRVYDEHKRRMLTDPQYAADLGKNSTLFFLAQQILPISPWDIGVSLSPWTRQMLDVTGLGPTYNRPFGLLGFGEMTTYQYVARILHEQVTEGHLDPSLERLLPRVLSLKANAPATDKLLGIPISEWSGQGSQQADALAAQADNTTPIAQPAVPEVPRLP